MVIPAGTFTEAKLNDPLLAGPSLVGIAFGLTLRFAQPCARSRGYQHDGTASLSIGISGAADSGRG